MSKARRVVVAVLILGVIVAVVVLVARVPPDGKPSRQEEIRDSMERAKHVILRGRRLAEEVQHPIRPEAPGEFGDAGPGPVREASPDPDAEATGAPVTEETPEEVRACLATLLAELRSTSQPSRRLDLLRELIRLNRDYVNQTGDLEFVLALRDIMNDSGVRAERKIAAIGLQRIDDPAGTTIGILETGTESPHDDVRFYCAEGLGWIRGPHAGRAGRKLASLLEQDDPAVREISALMIGLVTKDSGAMDPLLRRLEIERADRVLYALSRAVLALDPDGGADRITAVRPDIASVVTRAQTDMAVQR